MIISVAPWHSHRAKPVRVVTQVVTGAAHPHTLRPHPTTFGDTTTAVSMTTSTAVSVTAAAITTPQATAAGGSVNGATTPGPSPTDVTGGGGASLPQSTSGSIPTSNPLPFTNGSCYAFRHASDGTFMSYCANCIPGYPQSVIALDAIPLAWDVWCTEHIHGDLTQNTMRLRSNYSSLVLATLAPTNGSNATGNIPLILLPDNATYAHAHWSWTYTDATQQFGTFHLTDGPPNALLGLCRTCAWNATYPHPEAVMPGVSANNTDVQFSLVSMV